MAEGAEIDNIYLFRKVLEEYRDVPLTLEAAKVDILNAGDKDLLDIQRLPFKLEIMTPADYIPPHFFTSFVNLQ